MRKRIEIRSKICINDFDMSGADQLMNVAYRVQCAAVTPIGILFGLEIGLENGVENQNRRHHRDAIPDSGHS